MTEMLELTDKDFKAVIIKMLQGTTRNTLETNGKKKKYSVSAKKNKDREELKGNFRTEKYEKKFKRKKSLDVLN